MNQSITIMASYKVKPGNMETVLPLLQQMAEQSRLEPGNNSYDAFISTNEDNRIILVESYKDAAAIDAHRASAHFNTILLNQIVPLLEERAVHMLKPI